VSKRAKSRSLVRGEAPAGVAAASPATATHTSARRRARPGADVGRKGERLTRALSEPPPPREMHLWKHRLDQGATTNLLTSGVEPQSSRTK
jgi:hypothetical protein